MPRQMVRNPVHPQQLSLLQEVFDETCAEHQIDKDSPDAEALALILVNSLQKGSDDKDQLATLAENLAKSL
ncbi:hypothetical protein [Neorhizobium alkalisoli]|uniref:hypothetical protein n=1 Tax=Neorhizobium alkalisoli TaxID=528178 RepID=UPI00131A0923|nr:hypothetical protein [Neorhizobium alkalisoli]